MDIFDLASLAFFVFISFVLYQIFRQEKIESAESQSSHLLEFERLVEIKTRKKWLISFVAISLVQMLSVFLDLLIVTELDLAITLAISTLPVIPWFWITYHCSFKNRERDG